MYPAQNRLNTRLRGISMKIFFPLLALSFLWIGCKSEDTSGTSTTGSGTTAAESGPTFADVQPIFNQRCIACHGENGKEGIDLRTYDSVMKGGEPGPIVKAGNAAESLLVQIIKAGHAKRMPFKQDPLTDDQIKLIEDWVNGGAKS